MNDIFPERAVETDTTAKFLDTVLEKAEYDFWVCGHVHRDYAVPELNIAGLYNDIKSYDDIETALEYIHNNNPEM